LTTSQTKKTGRKINQPALVEFGQDKILPLLDQGNIHSQAGHGVRVPETGNLGGGVHLVGDDKMAIDFFLLLSNSTAQYVTNRTCLCHYGPVSGKCIAVPKRTAITCTNFCQNNYYFLSQ
jgi:hypothetical protein